MRAQVTYVSAAAAKGAHVYFFCARTRSLTAWNCCSETRRWTQRRGTCVISRRARRCCEEARYRRRPRGISDRCSRLIGHLCNATAPKGGVPPRGVIRRSMRLDMAESGSSTRTLPLFCTASPAVLVAGRLQCGAAHAGVRRGHGECAELAHLLAAQASYLRLATHAENGPFSRVGLGKIRSQPYRNLQHTRHTVGGYETCAGCPQTVSMRCRLSGQPKQLNSCFNALSVLSRPQEQLRVPHNCLLPNVGRP